MIIYLAVFDPEGLDFASTNKKNVEEFIKKTGRDAYYDIVEMDTDKTNRYPGVKFDFEKENIPLPNNIEVLLVPDAWDALQKGMLTGKDITIQNSRLQFNGVDIPRPDGDVARIDIILRKIK